MFGIQRLRRPQPKTKRPVFEFTVTNFFGRWMARKDWAGFTFPLGFFVLIFYWCPEIEVHGLLRVHEFVHVEQSERPGPFWGQYLECLWKGHGYGGNELEEEAYARQREAHDRGLPAWAKAQTDLS